MAWDGRLRRATEALIETEGATVTQHQLVCHVKAHAHEDQEDSMVAAIESNDCVDIENFTFTRIDKDNWLVEKAWDVDETIAGCEPMREALAHLAPEGTVDLDDEIVWQAFWDRWQEEHTEWYRSLPPEQKEFWGESDFPLEPYWREKARQVFERLREYFGAKPEFTAELCFWFTTTAEALPPENYFGPVF